MRNNLLKTTIRYNLRIGVNNFVTAGYGRIFFKIEKSNL